ncbi:MAG: DNA replication terminus site-binding protein [Candidatus Competibacterales bacterium]
MTDDIIALRVNVLQSFEAMVKALGIFTMALAEESLPAWVSRSEQERLDEVAVRVKAVAVFSALWYEDGQDGRETVTCPGLIGASRDTMAVAGACNDAKDAFKAAVLALKRMPRLKLQDIMGDLQTRSPLVGLAMRRMGVARLNLKQAYRHVPLLDARPLKVGFTWSKQGRTIQRTTVAEARQLLERRRESPQVQWELAQLDGIPEGEMLARVRRVCPHVRANIVFPADHDPPRRLIQAPLPLLLPLAPGEPLPEFVPVPVEPTPTPRLQRSDVRLEEEAFLPSVRVHRYRPAYR